MYKKNFFSSNKLIEISKKAVILEKDEEHWENIFWHNKNFNPGLGNEIDVIKFIPNWKKSKLIRIKD